MILRGNEFARLEEDLPVWIPDLAFALSFSPKYCLWIIVVAMDLYLVRVDFNTRLPQSSPCAQLRRISGNDAL